MLIAAIIIITLLSISSIGWTYAGVKVYRKITRFNESVDYFFTGQAGDKGSAFNQAINDISDVFAVKFSQATMASARGQLGGQAKAMNAEFEAIAKEGNPQLTLLDVLPKSLKRNPVAMQGLGMVLQKMMAGQLANNNNAHYAGDNQPVKFHL